MLYFGIVLQRPHFLLLLACPWALGCMNERTPEGPTAIEEYLAQDSAFLAGEDDKSLQHIGFDYKNLNRVVWQKPDLLLNRLGDLSDQAIVEVGAGTGFFTRRLAERARKVIALDIDPSMLLLLDSLNVAELDTAAYQRVDPRLVPADDPKLGEAEADAAIVVNTFMYIQEGADYLAKLAHGLAKGSPVLIVDFKKKSTPVGPPVATRMPLYKVETALKAAGFTDIQTDDTTLDYQYIVRGRVP